MGKWRDKERGIAPGRHRASWQQLAYLIRCFYLVDKGYHNHLLSIQLSLIKLWYTNVVDSLMPVCCTQTTFQWHRNGFGCCCWSLVRRCIVRQWSIHTACTSRLLVPVFITTQDNQTISQSLKHTAKLISHLQLKNKGGEKMLCSSC